MVIYIDVLLITNFFISYFLILSSAILSGYTFSRKNVVAAAVAGALCCLYIFVQAGNVFVDFTFKFISLIICAAIAFGVKDKKRLIIQTVCYMLLNMLLTGLISVLSVRSTMVYENNMFFYFSINPVMLVISSAVIYFIILLFEILKEKISPQNIYLFDIYFKDFSLKGLSAFYDSGFRLKDIVSNKDVIIVGYEKVKDGLPHELKNNICSFLNNRYSDVSGAFVPVFFNTLSGSSMIPAIKSEYISVENKKIKNVLVAFTLNELSENVAAIFGADIKKQL